MAGPVLELRNLNKEIPRPGGDPFIIFKNINLTVRDGEFVSIVGPSGCGKTTLLRVINGLMPHSGGQILIDGKSAEEVNQELLMGFVFQGASLLPWRTSLKNVLLGVEGRGQNAKDTEQRARKHLELVGLSGFENYYPHQLSGGMQQRVNLARALAVNPRILDGRTFCLSRRADAQLHAAGASAHMAGNPENGYLRNSHDRGSDPAVGPGDRLQPPAGHRPLRISGPASSSKDHGHQVGPALS